MRTATVCNVFGLAIRGTERSLGAPPASVATGARDGLDNERQRRSAIDVSKRTAAYDGKAARSNRPASQAAWRQAVRLAGSKTSALRRRMALRPHASSGGRCGPHHHVSRRNLGVRCHQNRERSDGRAPSLACSRATRCADDGLRRCRRLRSMVRHRPAAFW